MERRHSDRDQRQKCDKTVYVKASCSCYRSSSENPSFDGKMLKGSVHAYKNSKDYFSNIYRTWSLLREKTLLDLEILKAEVRCSQKDYNQGQEACREVTLGCRREKNSDSQVVDFLASFTAFTFDAISGIASVAHAVNVDKYQDKFKDIMERDGDITKKLYRARSQCVTKYRDIEEVMRNFHSDTFSSTMDKISNTLEFGKYWEGMKKAYENDNMPQLLNVLAKFLDNACDSRKLKEIGDSVESYVDDNPATLDAVKYAGRATYGAIDTFKINRSENKVLKAVDFSTNQLLMKDDSTEIQRLKSTREDGSPQSKLESQIAEAIDHLEREMREMDKIYSELFKGQNGSGVYTAY